MRKSIVIVGVLWALLTGCSHLSVKHLPQKPFQLNQTENISMRFWDFQYSVTMENNKYMVKGVAFPNTKVWPGWGEWLHDFALSAYLSDEHGIVLAKDLVSYPIQQVSSEGVSFSFSIPSETIPADKETFLSFGYRMSLTQSMYQSPSARRPLSGDTDVFTAIEGALSR
ncbi:MAG TPA: hypothetical protein ENN39_02910 [Desulfonatronum sp.]|nr:hypothetical protein [Desulfonatronum sp.]